MKVRYTKLPDLIDPGKYAWYPLLQVGLRHGTTGRQFNALVDSGAIDCIFPESLGRLLGIDIASGRPKTYFGIGLQASPGFVHSVNFRVTGMHQWLTFEAGFVSADIQPLLGQKGFFDNYQIVFERFRHQFEVNTRETALMRGRRGR